MRDRLSGLGERVAVGVSAAAKSRMGKTEHAATPRAWLDGALAGVPLPSVPAVGPWSLSVAELIGNSSVVPPAAVRALHVLDRFGSVSVGPEGLGLDSTNVAWRDVSAVRTAPVFELVTTAALEKEVDRLRGLLPPVPGRKWAVNRSLQAVQGLLERVFAEVTDGGAEVVAEVVYRGRLRREKQLHPGLAAALVMAAIPQVPESIIATAQLHNVVTDLAPSRSVRGLPEQRQRVTELVGRLQVERTVE